MFNDIVVIKTILIVLTNNDTILLFYSFGSIEFVLF